jgi:hypothetical protein
MEWLAVQWHASSKTKSRVHIVKIIEIKYKKKARILNNLYIMNA